MESLEIRQEATSLLDKNGWHDAVETAVAPSSLRGQPLSVLFIDVNHFKDINDQLGHDVGDEVIAQIQRMLVDNLRTGSNRTAQERDYVGIDFEPGHIGGDEFGILCRSDLEGARVLAER